MTHDFIKTGDPDVFPQIQDRNGEVCLSFCRRCRKGEGELEPECQSALWWLLDMAVSYAYEYGVRLTDEEWAILEEHKVIQDPHVRHGLEWIRQKPPKGF